MLEEEYDRDEEGRADQFAALQFKQAMADLKSGAVVRHETRKPCRECGDTHDSRIRDGYAICTSCMLDIGGRV